MFFVLKLWLVCVCFCCPLLPQLEMLRSRLQQLEGELADASEAASSIREELAGQADDQLQLALRQQALKYERQIQVGWGIVTSTIKYLT